MSIIVGFVQQAMVSSPVFKCIITSYFTVILPPPFTKSTQICQQLWRPCVCVNEVSFQLQLDIMTCKSASRSWPRFTNTLLLQLHLPAHSGVTRGKKPNFYHLLWRTLFISGWFIFKWASAHNPACVLSVCFCLPACGRLHVSCNKVVVFPPVIFSPI